MAVAAAANALTTVEDVKYIWGRVQTDTGYDDRIQTLINKLSERIEQWCARKFKSDTYTEEVYDGPCGDFIFLKQYPIIGDPVVRLNDVIVNADYYKVYPESGMIAGQWIPGRRNYKVTYTAGYAAIPAGLSEICIEWVIILLEGRMKDSKADHSEVGFEPQSITTGLSPFKRMDF